MVIRSPSALGAVIRDRRRERGLQQRALAEKVGVSRHWVMDVEKGKAGSEIGLILRTLRVLGIVLDASPASEPRAKPPNTAVDLDAIIEAARKPRR